MTESPVRDLHAALDGTEAVVDVWRESHPYEDGAECWIASHLESARDKIRQLENRLGIPGAPIQSAMVTPRGLSGVELARVFACSYEWRQGSANDSVGVYETNGHRVAASLEDLTAALRYLAVIPREGDPKRWGIGWPDLTARQAANLIRETLNGNGRYREPERTRGLS